MKRVLSRKFLFACLFLPFLYASTAAQTEHWTALTADYVFIKSADAEKSALLHGASLDWRFFSFRKNTRAGFYASVAAAYLPVRETAYTAGGTNSQNSFPAAFSVMLAPSFKFSLAESATFYVNPGVHLAVMPEFAFGIAADAGFNIHINDRFFFTVGAIGAVHFVGVDFFQGGNLRRYLSFDVRPYLGFGLKKLIFK